VTNGRRGRSAIREARDGHRTDVVIVGAGSAGSMAAWLLAARGLCAAAVDRFSVPGPFSAYARARFARLSAPTWPLSAQAFSALTASPGARAFYDHQRASGHGHNDALRRLASRQPAPPRARSRSRAASA
jgi:cation diffusion facilitator CzcD-associated flavoprotein CzcO